MCERFLFSMCRRTGLYASREQLHCVGFSNAFKDRHQIAQCRFCKCMSKIATQLFVSPQVKYHHPVLVSEGRRSHMPGVQRGDDPDLKSHFVFFIQHPALSRLFFPIAAPRSLSFQVKTSRSSCQRASINLGRTFCSSSISELVAQAHQSQFI